MAGGRRKHPTELGAKLGPRMARLTADAMTHHLNQSQGVRARIIKAGGVAFMDTITKEMQQHGGGIIAKLADHPATAEELRPLLRFMAHGSGEGAALLNFAVYGSGLSTPISALIANLLAPLQQDAIGNTPNSLLPPAAVADATARRIDFGHTNPLEAAQGGLNGSRFRTMVEAALSYPGIAPATDALNRGLISQEEWRKSLDRNSVPSEWIDPLYQMRHVILSPPDLALMALRGIITEEQGAAVAIKSGVEAHDFDLLVKATGEPLGLEQLLEAYRRGLIDEERLRHGIRQSRVRNEWFDVAEALRFEPASPADALRGVVQGHLSNTEGKAIFELGGIRGEDWDWLVKTEGNPAAAGQMIELWNRGLVTQAQVEQAIREGRIKNKYIPALLHLKRKIPSERVVITAVGHSAMTKDHGLELLRDQGFDQADAESILKAGLAQRTSHHKDLAKSDVLALFHGHVIDAAEATHQLAALGFDAHDAAWLLSLEDLRREKAYTDAALSMIGRLYAGWKIGPSEASTYLDGLGVGQQAKDHHLALWGLERVANRKHLTEGQVLHAYKKGLYTQQEAVIYLEAMGYAPPDAIVLVAGV